MSPIMSASDETLAQQAAAFEEIRQVKAAYCRCVDTKDFRGWAALFTPDARVDESEAPIARHPVTNERIPSETYSFEVLESLTAGIEWPLVGRDAIEAFGSTLTAGVTTVHHVHTPEIELTSETTAKAIWPMEDHAWFPEGAPVRYMHGFGHYHETYERLDDGRWYIKTIDVTRLRVDWK